MNAKDSLDGNMMIVRSGDLLTTEVDGELMAMSIEQGECYGLNGVGTRIWALLAEPRSLDSLCAAVMDEFDVDPATCWEQVAAFVEKMRVERLVTVKAA